MLSSLCLHISSTLNMEGFSLSLSYTLPWDIVQFFPIDTTFDIVSCPSCFFHKSNCQWLLSMSPCPLIFSHAMCISKSRVEKGGLISLTSLWAEIEPGSVESPAKTKKGSLPALQEHYAELRRKSTRMWKWHRNILVVRTSILGSNILCSIFCVSYQVYDTGSIVLPL